MRWMFLALVGALLSAGPAAADVAVSVDPQADFSSYRTYSWVEGDPAHIPEIRAYLVRRIDEQLKAAGLRKIEADGDLNVAIHVATDSSYQQTSTYWRSLTYDVAFIGSDVRGSTDLTLIVDLVDRKANRAIWQGRATDALFDYEHEKLRKKVDRTTKKMFSDFPPP